MYLIIFPDGTSKIIHDNLTVIDMLSPAKIFKLSRKGTSIEVWVLRKDLETYLWEIVEEAGVIFCADGRLHL